MAIYKNTPPTVTNGLVLNLDAANTLSYVSGSTVWNDLSGRGVNGTLVNGPTFDSQNAGSISFDGVDDLVNLNQTVTSSEWTISSFIKLDSFQKIRNIQYYFLTSNTAGTRSGRALFEFTYSVSVGSILLDSSGSIFLGGRICEYNGVNRELLIKLDSSGSILTEFNTGLVVIQTQDVTGLAADSTGSIYYVGYNIGNLTKINPTTGAQLQRVATVNSGITQANVILDEPNNKVYIGGWFTSIQGTAAQRIARLNLSTMTIDTTFNTTTGFVNTEDVQRMALQPDGKLVVGGQFTSYKGSSYNRIIRLNSDASIDTSFNPGVGFNGTVRNTVLQPDGKILVGGQFTTYSGSSQPYFIRLNTDGTRDTSFNIGTGFNSSTSPIALQPDGKILVGGQFTVYSGSTQNYITRLNPDGTRDTTFNIGVGFNSAVQSIAVQPDGKILVGGGFTEYSGSTCNNIIRLNSSGSVDTDFNSGTGIFGAYRLNNQIIYVNSAGSITTQFFYGITSPLSFDWRRYETAVTAFSGSFSYYCVTKDSTATYRQYWDSRLRNTSAIPTALNTSIDTNRIGVPTGKIATYQVYNRALSQQEILQNYNALKSRFNLT